MTKKVEEHCSITITVNGSVIRRVSISSYSINFIKMDSSQFIRTMQTWPKTKVIPGFELLLEYPIELHLQ